MSTKLLVDGKPIEELDWAEVSNGEKLDSLCKVFELNLFGLRLDQVMMAFMASEEKTFWFLVLINLVPRQDKLGNPHNCVTQYKRALMDGWTPPKLIAAYRAYLAACEYGRENEKYLLYDDRPFHKGLFHWLKDSNYEYPTTLPLEELEALVADGKGRKMKPSGRFSVPPPRQMPTHTDKASRDLREALVLFFRGIHWPDGVPIPLELHNVVKDVHHVDKDDQAKHPEWWSEFWHLCAKWENNQICGHLYVREG